LTVVALGLSGYTAAATAQRASVEPVPAPPDFSRVATPDECAFHAVWAEDQFWRLRHQDTLFVPPAGAPRQRQTVAEVGRCVSRFTVAGTDVRNLLGLGRAYLAAEQFVQADSAFQRLAQSSSSRSDRAWTLSKIVEAYLDDAVPNVAAAERYVAQLDTMSVASAPEQMLAHVALAKVAHRRDSVVVEAREWRKALDASARMVGDARYEYASVSADAYIGMATLKGRQFDGQGALATLAEGGRVLVPLRPGLGRRFEFAKTFFPMVGKPAPVLRATHWYGGDSVASYPRPGKTTLVVFAGMGTTVYPTYALVRRLGAAFSRSQLDIVFVTQTAGYFGESLVSPDSEAALQRHYYLDDRRLPIILGVWQAPYARDDDGSRRNTSLPNDEAYQRAVAAGLVAYVVGPDGKIRYVTTLISSNELGLKHVLSSLVASAREGSPGG